MINLVKDTIGNDDIDKLVDWLKTYPRLTKGPLTLEFEKQWSEYLGVSHSTYVNSGSSANLLALYALLESKRIKRTDKVVVPAVSWATDLSPVFQLGMTPILCDVNPKNLAIDIAAFKKIIRESSPRVLILVHVLGLVCDIQQIKDLCRENNIILIEDTCEALGSKFKNKKLGTFGDISTFSFYFGHHMSTIEGGMISTNDAELDALFRSLRNHGWDRDWEPARRKKIREENRISEFDGMYTFYYSGFNVRATDLQAFLGMNQLKKIDEYCRVREKNYKTYHRLVSNNTWKPELNDDCFVSNFAWPIINKKRDLLANALINENIECRPLICGSMGKQPFYVKNMGSISLPVSDNLHKFGMYVPNHQSLTDSEIEKICNIINKNI